MSLTDLMLLVPSRCGISEEPNPSIPCILVNLGQSSRIQDDFDNSKNSTNLLSDNPPPSSDKYLSLPESSTLHCIDIISLQHSGSCNTQMLCNQMIQRVHCVVIHNRDVMAGVVICRNSIRTR